MTIKVVGIGLEGAKSLTTDILSIVNNSTVLVGGKRHLNYFPKYLGITLIIKDIYQIIQTIKKYQQRQEKIVILATGDPLLFGIGRILVQEFTLAELEFYPYLSSVQLAFNRLKIPWQSAQIISVHGRNTDTLIKTWKKAAKIIAILTDNQHNPLVIWQLYRQLKLPINYDFWLCEDIGSAQEKITLITTEKELQLDNISPLNLLILQQKDNPKLESIDLEKLPFIGIEDHLFCTFTDRPGLITKKEIRTLILSALDLHNQQTVWDIGAGTGSVSIEIARIMKHSDIYAIEKTAIGASLITANCRRFQVDNITVINDQGENVISTLPNVDRVFIGGSNGQLTPLLDIIAEKIKPQGKVVIALATLENLYLACQWFKTHQWQYQIMHVQINKSLSIVDMTRFNPLNPINIITAHKAQETFL